MLNKHLKRCFALSSLERRDKLDRHLLPCVPIMRDLLDVEEILMCDDSNGSLATELYRFLW